MSAAESQVPRRADARRNRAALLAVAEEVLAEDGEGFALEAVARRAGVGKGTLYRHFPTRDDLLDALLGAWVDGLEAHVDACLDARHDADLVRAFLLRVLGTMPGDGTVHQLLRQHDHRRGAPQRRRVLRAFDRLAEAARAAGAVDPSATRDDLVLAVAMLDAAARVGERRAALGEPVDVARQVDVLVRGLAPHG